jgi:hypothetical protein
MMRMGMMSASSTSSSKKKNCPTTKALLAVGRLSAFTE